MSSRARLGHEQGGANLAPPPPAAIPRDAGSRSRGDPVGTGRGAAIGSVFGDDCPHHH